MPNQFFTPAANIKQWKINDGMGTVEASIAPEGQIRWILKLNGVTKEIPSHDVEGLPIDISKNPKLLAQFIQRNDTYVCHRVLSDGSSKIYVEPKLKGGANITRDPNRLWSNAYIPIVVDCQSFENNIAHLQQIIDAVTEWATKTKFTFEVHLKNLAPNSILAVKKQPIQIQVSFDGFHPVNLKSDHVFIQKYTDVCKTQETKDEKTCNVCQSFVGRQGGMQVISCKLGGGFNTQSIMHELGHAIGFEHEQMRYDRDTFVRVEPKFRNSDVNFGKTSRENMHGHYDFASIMHYYFDRKNMKIQSQIPQMQHDQIKALGGFAGSNFTDQTIALVHEPDPQSSGIWNGVLSVGNVTGLSTGDIAAANYLAEQALALNQIENEPEDLNLNQRFTNLHLI